MKLFYSEQTESVGTEQKIDWKTAEIRAQHDVFLQ